MAFLYITEYARQAKDTNGLLVPAGEEPALAYQKIANDGASVASAALNAKTRFVRLHSDSICSIKVAAVPVAVTTENRLAAGSTEFFGVNSDDVKSTAGLKIAAVLNT